MLTRILILAGSLFFLAYVSVKYVSGLKIFAAVSVLFLVFIFSQPLTPFCLLVLFFWVPRALNYLFLNDIFVFAPIIEVSSYMFMFMYLLMGAIKRRGYLNSIVRTPLLTPITIFIIGCAIAYLSGAAVNRQLAYMWFRQNTFFAFTLYALSASIVKDANSARKVTTTLVISNFFLALFIFYSYYFGANVIEKYTPGRLGGEFILFGNTSVGMSAIIVGNQMANMIPFGVALILLGKRAWHKFLGIMVLFLFSLVLVSSGTRAAWIAGLIGACPVIILTLRHSRSSLLYKISLFLFVILGLAVILFAGHWSLQHNEYLADRVGSLMYASKEASLIERVDIWIYCFKAFLRYPLGMGFMEEYPLGFITVYPHSLYLGLLLCSGFLGAVGFLWFIIAWLKKILRSIVAYTEDGQIILAACLGSSLAFLTYGIFEHPMYNSTIIMPTMWIIWGTAIGLARNIPQGD